MNSMTGFGRREGRVGHGWFTVELKSVNHRYQDIRFRLPSTLSAFEPKVSEVLRDAFERGSFEVSIRQKAAPNETQTSGALTFQVDTQAAASFAKCCQQLTQTLGRPIEPHLEAMVAAGRILIPVEQSLDFDKAWNELRDLIQASLEDLTSMREAEGARLKTLLKSGVGDISKSIAQMEIHAAKQPERIREKLNQRIAKWDFSAKADPQRLEWEIAYYAERSDVTEEIHRLKSHIEAFGQLLDKPGAIGRKLDFLTQEMHREVNTMGSKSSLVELTQVSVEAKTSIEKLREQVQNVE